MDTSVPIETTEKQELLKKEEASETPDFTEEERSPLAQFRRYGLKVTDLSSQAWCEQQFEFVLHHGQKKTKAMRQGTKRHRELHEEITEVVEVETQTREDRWGLHLFNAWAGLKQLQREGLCREVPVFGQLQGVWFLGIIDQLEHDETGSVLLSDNKTRRRASLPSEAQKLTTRLQLMLYRQLFEKLATSPFPIQEFFDELNLDSDASFSPTFLEGLEQHGLPSATLGTMFPITLSAFQQVTELSTTLLTRYEWQEDRSHLGTDEFSHSPQWLRFQVKSSLDYWYGQRAARGVPRSERWKCRFCDFQDQCPFS